MIVDQPPQACAHKGCRCEVPAGQTYCSPYCANAATTSASEPGAASDQTSCACGHPPCGGRAADAPAA